MIRKLYTSVPKYFIAALIILASIGAFVLWWFLRSCKGSPTAYKEVPRIVVDIATRQRELVLIDNALYDLGNGKLVAKDWLTEGSPVALFFDAKRGKVIARYEYGFIRYNTDGTVDAKMLGAAPPAFSDDLKWVVYGKDKDIWRADVDWNDLRFTNEKQVTSTGQFNERYLAENIVLATEKHLVVRNNNQLLRVGLESGETKPMRLPLGDIGKRRSLDASSVVGVERGQFYFYNLDTDEPKTLPFTRLATNDYQWVSADKCALIVAMRTVMLYDRHKHQLTEITTLPVPCNILSDPSPDGRYVFCRSRGGNFLVDLEKKTAKESVAGPGAIWLGNDMLAFSRETSDSTLRGTWVQKIGEKEKRAWPEPYLIGGGGGMIMPSPQTVSFSSSEPE